MRSCIALYHAECMKELNNWTLRRYVILADTLHHAIHVIYAYSYKKRLYNCPNDNHYCLIELIKKILKKVMVYV